MEKEIYRDDRVSITKSHLIIDNRFYTISEISTLTIKEKPSNNIIALYVAIFMIIISVLFYIMHPVLIVITTIGIILYLLRSDYIENINDKLVIEMKSSKVYKVKGDGLYLAKIIATLKSIKYNENN